MNIQQRIKEIENMGLKISRLPWWKKEKIFKEYKWLLMAPKHLL